MNKGKPRTPTSRGGSRSTAKGAHRRPSRDELLAYIRDNPDNAQKRALARAFNLKGPDRVWLRDQLRDLADEGLIHKGRGRRFHPPGALPPVAVLVVTGSDPDGDLLARPEHWDGNKDGKPAGPPPRIYLAPDRRGGPALGPGDRVLARLAPLEGDDWQARPIRVLDRGATQAVVGLLEKGPGGASLYPADRRRKGPFHIDLADLGEAGPGDLVRADPLPRPRGRHPGRQWARVSERLGHRDDPGVLTTLACHLHDIPDRFPAAALAEADRLTAAGLGRREDLRTLPLVTIDGADARDFDDAVWAAADDDPGNPGGFHLIVAIADVAWYVRPGSELDRSAFLRGNSVYFPDRAVPMLPERLSNDLCSLRPAEDRACLAVHLWIDREGKLLRQRFVRGLMRSAARLTYQQVQAAHEGTAPDGPPLDRKMSAAELRDRVIPPLYAAFAALQTNRRQRGTLDLDIPERVVTIDAAGKVSGIHPAPRYDSHRLIEEFMISANVAAATVLGEKQVPFLYRIHDTPDPQAIGLLRETLDDLGYRLTAGERLRPRHFTGILDQATATDEAQLISDLILRAQARATYSPHNIGHFGLALARYCHFTSPIRRYADLIVHRALIATLGLAATEEESNDGALTEGSADLESIGLKLGETERRAQLAERDATDRYSAAFLASGIGNEFSGRISGVTRFGLFVRLDESAADGIIPLGSLDDYYVHDPRRHALVGRHRGAVLRLGDAVVVQLEEAAPLTGSLVFSLIAHSDAPRAAGRSSKQKAGDKSKPPKGKAKKPGPKKAKSKKVKKR